MMKIVYLFILNHFIFFIIAKDIFVHQSTIHSDGFRSLAEGEIVEFDLVTDPKGIFIIVLFYLIL